jgi:hypothetical protein
MGLSPFSVSLVFLFHFSLPLSSRAS